MSVSDNYPAAQRQLDEAAEAAVRVHPLLDRMYGWEGLTIQSESKAREYVGKKIAGVECRLYWDEGTNYQFSCDIFSEFGPDIPTPMLRMAAKLRRLADGIQTMVEAEKQ